METNKGHKIQLFTERFLSELYELLVSGYCQRGTVVHKESPVPASIQTSFSLEQAQAMLPLLRLIVADISLSHRELNERKSNLRRMLRSHQGKPRFQVYDQEIVEMQRELSEQSGHLDDYISELEGLGVILRSAHDGIVDFPTVIDDQSAFYTWKMGEADVGHFH